MLFVTCCFGRQMGSTSSRMAILGAGSPRVGDRRKCHGPMIFGLFVNEQNYASLCSPLRCNSNFLPWKKLSGYDATAMDELRSTSLVPQVAFRQLYTCQHILPWCPPKVLLFSPVESAHPPSARNSQTTQILRGRLLHRISQICIIFAILLIRRDLRSCTRGNGDEAWEAARPLANAEMIPAALVFLRQRSFQPMKPAKRLDILATDESQRQGEKAYRRSSHLLAGPACPGQAWKNMGKL